MKKKYSIHVLFSLGISFIFLATVNLLNINFVEDVFYCDSPPYIYKGDNETDISEPYPIIWWCKRNFDYYNVYERTIPCGNIKCLIRQYENSTKVQTNRDAYIYHPDNMIETPSPILPKDPSIAIWGFIFEESPNYCTECYSDKLMTSFNYSSTYSRHSDVPFPLLWMISLNNITNKIYFYKTSQKNDYLNEISPIVYLQSDCRTSTQRDLYVKELMKYQSIDSYGRCLNNKKLPNALLERNHLLKFNSEEILRLIAKYKFVISIENGVCEDYITEKFWRAIHLGVVPIYFGSPSISHWFPNNKSAILLQDFPTPKLLSAHIDKLMGDDNLYEEYLEHKTKGLISNKNLIKEAEERTYQLHFKYTVEKFQCFLCEKLYSLREEPLPYSVINRSHYNCPLPTSALTLNVNSDWANMIDYTILNMR